MRRRLALLVACVALGAAPAAAEVRVVAKRGGVLAPPALGAPAPALVTLELFCDHAQSGCTGLVAEASALVEAHPDETRLVIRTLPVRRLALSVALAELAWEAHAQGRFPAFLEVVGSARHADKRDLLGLAARAGLDVAAAERALADGRHQARLADDALWATRLGAAGAPALAWNGAVSGLPAAPSVWEEAWQDAARRARAVDATGVAPARRYATLVRNELARRADAAWRRGLPEGAVPAPRVNVPVEGAPALAPPGARALLVAFGDYTANTSRALARDLHQLDGEYPGALKIVWKHAPAARPDAQAAARAAACAQRQDQFWELHRRLIAYHYRLGREELVDLAAAAGLVLDRFVDDFDGGACEARVEDDLADARALGVEPGSFALFVNGRRVPGEYSGAAVRAILDDELAPGDLAALSAP